jgi:hypothetical protein
MAQKKGRDTSERLGTFSSVILSNVSPFAVIKMTPPKQGKVCMDEI